MLVRHCNRCDKIIKNEPYWTFESRHYLKDGGYNHADEFDLCEECFKKFQFFLKT